MSTGHLTPSGSSVAGRRPDRWGSGLVTSPWLWLSAVVCFVVSPALFLSTLVVGAALVPFGVIRWRSNGRIALLAVALGMTLGSLPYLTAGLRVATS